jgi:hypothetical protein
VGGWVRERVYWLSGVYFFLMTTLALLLGVLEIALQTSTVGEGKRGGEAAGTGTGYKAVPPIDEIASTNYKTVTFGSG